MPYSRVAQHSSMLFDSQRNALYARAIGQLVTPESVVLDLGAGMGLHGLLAAAAGARHVYLVEPEPVIHAAAEAARANGLADRVTVLQGRIEDVQLPQPVDLIASVFTGNLLFSEDLLPSLFHARDRWLKPGGRLLPDRAELLLAPLHAPGLHAEHVARWSEPVMGLDYGGARRFAANEIQWPPRDELRGTEQLADGAVLADVDLATAARADCKGAATCRVAQSAVCHWLLAWTRIRLLDQWLSTDPAADVHWRPVLMPLDPPLPLQQGEDLHIALERPAWGDWTWSVRARAGTRRHSSFLARSESVADLRRLAPASRPGLGSDGAQSLRILQGLQQGLSNREIADALAADGLDAAQALVRVQAMAYKYGRRG
ncbi:MAG: class I SAM-dependent methyltransferase [Pseudomonadota bacterium]